MTSFAPLPNRYFIFNFFEKPEDVEAYKAGWCKAADYIMDNDDFVSTHLHCSTSDTTRYPWVNVALAQTDDICMFGKPDEQWLNLTLKNKGPVATKGTPAGFREIASYKGNKLVQDDKYSSKTSRFFITAVKVADNITDEQLEENWAEWSGTDFLREKLKNENLKDSFLYKRFTTKLSPVFRYTVRTEVDDLSDASGHAIAMETNQRSLPAGVETTTGFYQVAISFKGKAAA